MSSWPSAVATVGELASAAMQSSGAALALLGLLWAAWAALTLAQAHRQAGTRRGMPPRLVDEGPFRWGRHPMYLGAALALVGFALALAWPWLLVAALAFVAAVQRWRIPHEEQQLRRAFGGWYSDYASSVRPWL